jgi:homoserine O-acetyltransferase
MSRSIILLAITLLMLPLTAVFSADYPAPKEADFIIRDFPFASGETLPELRIHYATLGTPQRDAQGVVRNAVLILHGTGGDEGQFLRRGAQLFAGELFGAGQPLDATKYFIVIPANIGHGKSSKPSDGLCAKFPHYGYRGRPMPMASSDRCISSAVPNAAMHRPRRIRPITT